MRKEVAERGRGAVEHVRGNGLPDDELKLIAEAGASVPTGLGVDSVTGVTCTPSLMLATLLSAHLSEAVHVTPADLLRMATVEGAVALGMADRVGSLAPGKHADLVVLRASDINLLGTRNPIAAVVTAAHPGNVEGVFVGGVEIRQQDVAAPSGMPPKA
ncbi:amidohydrolase family protein [Lentzea rhizosphaerae]|uniref:Amidohydrolase family protein n=1 Tax=Lentzea rhizosphaerae TaxID=2041025 RepID=A0ABV8BMF7_9PSEU